MTDLIVATVGDVSSSGITLIIPPATTASEKHYKCLATGEIIAANDMVLCAKIDGTYVVLGKVDTETGGDEGGDEEEDEGGSIPAGGTAGQLLAKASNADYDVGFINDINVKPPEIGIVITGARPAVAVSAGQYVIVRNSTISGISDGLYTANSALPTNTNVTASKLTAVSKGGLNALNDGLSTFDGRLNTLDGELDALDGELDTLDASALKSESIKSVDVSVGNVSGTTSKTASRSVSLDKAPSAFWLGKVTVAYGSSKGIILNIESFGRSGVNLSAYNPTSAAINNITATVFYIE